jgi:hypothetical protein
MQAALVSRRGCSLVVLDFDGEADAVGLGVGAENEIAEILAIAAVTQRSELSVLMDVEIVCAQMRSRRIRNSMPITSSRMKATTFYLRPNEGFTEATCISLLLHQGGWALRRIR